MKLLRILEEQVVSMPSVHILSLIATGTPAGVGMGFNPPKFLKTGDKVICEIDKIGRLENTIGE